MVLESDGNVCIDCSRLLNNVLTLGNVEVSRIWSCYTSSRETWIQALYFRLNWRKRHVRNLFREKDIDHFDNQMCGCHFLLKPGVHKLLEIKQFSDKLPQMKWLLTNQQTENGATASWDGFQSLQPSRWAQDRLTPASKAHQNKSLFDKAQKGHFPGFQDQGFTHLRSTSSSVFWPNSGSL